MSSEPEPLENTIEASPHPVWDYIGVPVVMPDGGKGTIRAVCVSGQIHSVEYKVVWWYGGDRREAWLERAEFAIVSRPVGNPPDQSNGPFARPGGAQ